MDEKLQEMIRRVVKKGIWQEVEFSELVRKMAEEYETQSFQYQEKDIFLERKEEKQKSCMKKLLSKKFWTNVNCSSYARGIL